MSTLKNIRRKIAAGIYELTHHAESEKEADDLTTQDVECAIRYGRIVTAYMRYDRTSLTNNRQHIAYTF